MSNSSLQQWTYRTVIIVLIALVAGWLLVGYVERSFAPIEKRLVAVIEETLVKVQKVTEDGSAVLRNKEQTIDVWLYDKCSASERRGFEEVIRDLGTGLTATQLQYLQSWFDRCGTVVAQRNAYIAQEVSSAAEYLERSLVLYELLPDMYKKNEEVLRIDIDTWHSYAAAWQEYAAQQFVLDELQRSLIDARAEGVSLEDPQITDLLKEVEVERNVLSEYHAELQEIQNQLEL